MNFPTPWCNLIWYAWWTANQTLTTTSPDTKYLHSLFPLAEIFAFVTFFSRPGCLHVRYCVSQHGSGRRGHPLLLTAAIAIKSVQNKNKQPNRNTSVVSKQLQSPTLKELKWQQGPGNKRSGLFSSKNRSPWDERYRLEMVRKSFKFTFENNVIFVIFARFFCFRFIFFPEITPVFKLLKTSCTINLINIKASNDSCYFLKPRLVRAVQHFNSDDN